MFEYQIVNALHLTLKIMLKWGFFHTLLVCKAKSLKRKVFFNAWRREVCSNTANSTRWKDNSNLTFQNPPAPPCQLPVSYVTVLLMFWALIRVMVLLFVLVPSCLQYPVVQAERIKTWVLRNANKRLGQPFVFDCFVVFGNNTVNFGATDALFYTLKTLAIPTSTPKV